MGKPAATLRDISIFECERYAARVLAKKSLSGSLDEAAQLRDRGLLT
jgi:hypothetical protein